MCIRIGIFSKWCSTVLSSGFLLIRLRLINFLNKPVLSFRMVAFFFLYRCRKVCQFWRHLFNSEWIWHQLCHAPKWRLGDSENQAQLERHRLSGSLCWRSVFRERFKLKRSWLRGQCHVRTFEVRFHTSLDKLRQV